MENCAVSKHHLEFKGLGFSLSASGVVGIVAAVVIVALLVWIPKPF
jgi:hypothetical protein